MCSLIAQKSLQTRIQPLSLFQGRNTISFSPERLALFVSKVCRKVSSQLIKTAFSTHSLLTAWHTSQVQPRLCPCRTNHHWHLSGNVKTNNMQPTKLSSLTNCKTHRQKPWHKASCANVRLQCKETHCRARRTHSKTSHSTSLVRCEQNKPKIFYGLHYLTWFKPRTKQTKNKKEKHYKFLSQSPLCN